MTQEVRAEHVSPPMKLYKPPVSYPQRLVKAKEDHKYGKFLKMLKNFHINIPFLEAITDMPSYAKFLKDLLSNKGKLLENATVALIKECSAIIQNKLPLQIQEVSPFLVQLGMWLSAGHYATLGLAWILCLILYATGYKVGSGNPLSSLCS